MSNNVNVNVGFSFSPTHATIHPAIATKSPTVQGQILELMTFLINANVGTISLDPDFVTQRIIFSGEFPLWVVYKDGVVAFTTSDSTPYLSGPISIGPS